MVKKKPALKPKVVTPTDLFRKLDDKPTMPELETLKKAVFHSIKMSFDVDPSGESSILLDGKPVKGKADKVELMDLYNKIINTYATL